MDMDYSRAKEKALTEEQMKKIDAEREFFLPDNYRGRRIRRLAVRRQTRKVARAIRRKQLRIESEFRGMYHAALADAGRAFWAKDEAARAEAMERAVSLRLTLRGLRERREQERAKRAELDDAEAVLRSLMKEARRLAGGR